MTTNGIAIKHRLQKYKDSGLTHINISLDTLIEAKFNFITRRQGVTKVLENINLAAGMNFDRVKINCVLMRGVNDDEIFDFIELTKDLDIDVRFIEFMPFSENSNYFYYFCNFKFFINFILTLKI
jgi:cyclic pyranopterin phosphate synthase